MIYGAEPFLLAYATWGLEQWRPSPANPDRSAAPAAAAPSAGRIAASTAKGAAQTSPFATACSSFAPPDRRQQDRGRLLPQPALADGPVLGTCILDLERRRETGARRGFAAPAEVPRPPPARRRHRRVNTSWLRQDWSIAGVDTSTTLLAACRRRNCGRNLRLVLSEAEDLPCRDREFDAVLSNGGFDHFNDPEAALREMARVAKAGAPVVVAHEMPHFLAFGHRLGLPGLDRWIASRLMNMGDDFAGLIERHRNIDIAGIGRRLLNDSR